MDDDIEAATSPSSIDFIYNTAKDLVNSMNLLFEKNCIRDINIIRK